MIAQANAARGDSADPGSASVLKAMCTGRVCGQQGRKATVATERDRWNKQQHNEQGDARCPSRSIYDFAIALVLGADGALAAVSRREALKVSLAGAAGLLLSESVAGPVAGSAGWLGSSWSSAGKRVVVIGAGFGGLACGCELKSAGYDVTIVEARGRVGGRVLSSTTSSPGRTSRAVPNSSVRTTRPGFRMPSASGSPFSTSRKKRALPPSTSTASSSETRRATASGRHWRTPQRA